MTQPTGPAAKLSGNVRDISYWLGLPVLSDDGFHHTSDCYWCDGNADNDTCRRSIAMRESHPDSELLPAEEA